MKKKTKRTNLIFAIILWLCGLVVIIPLAMVLVTSFKTYGEANFLSLSLPEEPIVDNYIQVWEEGKIFRSFLNSVLISSVSVVLVTMLSAMLAYILMRRPTGFNNLVHKIMTFGIIAPFAALPTIQVLKGIHLYGTYASLMFVYAALYMPFSTILFSSFMSTVPTEIDEAAVIDGCSGWKLFLKVVFPLLKPVTVTVAMLNFMWVWNDFQYPMYLLNTSKKWTLPLSVYSFFGQYNRSWHLVCADMVLVSIPVVLIYIFAQKYIVSGMTAGAVKG
ncbi:MAG: carbohydrate ABC transporter permease [Oliverpabstia sp.]